MKINAQLELKRKNLIGNENKTEDYCIQWTENQSWKSCLLLWSLLGIKEGLTNTSLPYGKIKSASNSESKYFKLLYHLYFFITLSYGLSQTHRTINWTFFKKYPCDKLYGIVKFLTAKCINCAILNPGLMKSNVGGYTGLVTSYAYLKIRLLNRH